MDFQIDSDLALLGYLYAKERFTLLESFQAGEQALQMGMGLFSRDFQHHCMELAGLRAKYTEAQLQGFRKEIDQSRERGHLILYPGHPLFPKEYLYLEEVPYHLRLKGNPIWMKRAGLAVVGSREPSMMSCLWMNKHLAEFFRRQFCFSVSGGARGVDQKTHLLSLTAGRPTVVLLPAGLEKMYPTSILDLRQEILAQGGAFLSEYEDQRGMQKHFFAQRNRLISGLACATLIVEARLKSGTLLTAQEAVEQHRPVWVLPGHPMDPGAMGGLNLLHDGATVIRDAEDLVKLFESEALGMTEPSEPLGKHLVEASGTVH